MIRTSVSVDAVVASQDVCNQTVSFADQPPLVTYLADCPPLRASCPMFEDLGSSGLSAILDVTQGVLGSRAVSVPVAVAGVSVGVQTLSLDDQSVLHASPQIAPSGSSGVVPDPAPTDDSFVFTG